MTKADRHKKVKVRAKLTKRGDLEVSFSGDLDLDRVVDRAVEGGAKLVQDAMAGVGQELDGMRKKKVVQVTPQVSARRIPDLTEEEKARQEPPLTRLPRRDGPAMCPVCKVRVRDCPSHGSHPGREDIVP